MRCSSITSLILLCFASLLAGCTTQLEAGQALASDPSSRQGIAYNLPFTQFDVEAGWTVADCTTELTLVPSIRVASSNAADPAAIYTIDYASLDAWTKTSSVKVDFYDSGSIKSINAAADDRTAEIAAKTIETVGKVVAFAGVGGNAKPVRCSQTLQRSLQAIKVQTTLVARLSASLTKETEALDALTVRVVKSGAAIPRAILDAQDRAIARVSGSQMELDAAKGRLGTLRSSVTYSTKKRFPETSGGELKASLRPSASALADWIDDLESMVPPGGSRDTALKSYIEAHAMYLEVSSQGSWETGTDFDGGKRASRLAGIRYRVAVPAILKACRSDFCSKLAEGGAAVDPIDEVPVRLIARGTTFYLPFHSAPFTNASLSATFSEAGVLTSAGYEQKKAAGEAMATTAALLADQIVTVGGKIREARKTAMDVVKEETALLNATAERDAARKKLEVSPEAATLAQSTVIKADIELKNARIDDARADLALKEAMDARLAAGITP